MNIQKHTCYIHIHNITINTGTRLCGSFDCLVLRTYTVCAWDLWTAEWPNSAHSCIWHLIWETLEVTDVFQFARKSRTSSRLYGNVILHHGKRSKRAYCAACSCLTDKIQMNENKEGWVKKKKKQRETETRQCLGANISSTDISQQRNTSEGIWLTRSQCYWPFSFVTQVKQAHLFSPSAGRCWMCVCVCVGAPPYSETISEEIVLIWGSWGC